MSLDLGSPIVEIAIGLSFVFFLLSLIVSAGTELIAWASKQRAHNLVKGIEGLLGDEAVAGAVMAHPLVQSDVTTPPAEDKPSYVSARNFTLALLQTVREKGGAADKTFDELKRTIAAMPADSPLGAQLQGLLAEGESSAAEFRKSVEDWFDDGMDRVSGWYKRWAQKIGIGIAIAVTIGLNVSAVRVVERLATDPAVRSAVVARAETAVKTEKPGSSSEAGPKAAGEKVQDAYADLESLKLPFMWSGENVPWASPQAAVLSLIGWALTIAAISLGAPFWFDALGRLARLRTTGVRPGAEPAK